MELRSRKSSLDRTRSVQPGSKESLLNGQVRKLKRLRAPNRQLDRHNNITKLHHRQRCIQVLGILWLLFRV